MSESQHGSRQLVWLAVVAAVAIIGVGGWLVSSRTSRSPKSNPGTPEKITVAQWGQERYLIYLPLYVAMEEGFFKNEGLDVSLVFTGNDDQTFAAVVGGSAQFGVGDPAFAAISNERGLDARVVGTVVGGVAIWGVTNNDKVGLIQKPADLAGLRVGTFPSPSTNYTLMRALIDQHPQELKGTKIIEAGIGAQIALLESNSADIAMVLEPAASVAEAQGYRVVYSSSKFHGPFAFTGVTTTAAYVDKNKDVVARFVRALQKAAMASHNDRSVAVRVGTKLFSSIDASVVERAVNRMLDEQTFPKDVEVDAQAWAALIDVRLKVGDLKSPQPMSQTVDNSFAKSAKGAG